MKSMISSVKIKPHRKAWKVLHHGGVLNKVVLNKGNITASLNQAGEGTRVPVEVLNRVPVIIFI